MGRTFTKGCYVITATLGQQVLEYMYSFTLHLHKHHIAHTNSRLCHLMDKFGTTLAWTLLFLVWFLFGVDFCGQGVITTTSSWLNTNRHTSLTFTGIHPGVILHIPVDCWIECLRHTVGKWQSFSLTLKHQGCHKKPLPPKKCQGNI